MAKSLGPEAPATPEGNNTPLLIVSWLWVGGPLAWGVWKTLETSMELWR